MTTPTGANTRLPDHATPDPESLSGDTFARSPRVSIGVPVYNGARYVAQALNAIAQQTFDNFEVIISDNGSTDETRDICERFAEEDKRFRYVRQSENRGGAWNFNEVSRLASGEYFKWAAHDDLMAPTFLEVCVRTLDAAPPEVVLCYPRTTLIDADGVPISDYEDNLDLRERMPAARFRSYLRNYELSNAIFGLFRIDSLRQTRLEGPYNSADVVLFSEIVLVGQVWEIPDRLFMRRWHDEMSLLANPSNKAIAQWYNPNNTGSRFMPRTRLFAENVRAIGMIRMSMLQRVRCIWALLSEWGPRYWRVVGGEFKHELKAMIAGRDDSGG